MDPARLGIALGAGAAFGVVAWRTRALTPSGAVAGGLFGAELIALGGWPFAAPALAFFVLSTALSKAGAGRKRDAEALAEKGSRRDAGQVLANGGVAMATLAAFAVVPAEAVPPAVWVGAFVGSLAAAAADTWGTEIGTAVGGPTRRLGVGAEVPPGTSGGVSLAGTLGGLAGAASVTGAAVLAGAVGIAAAAALTAVGVAGSLADTALGATLQARYRLPDGRLTERPEADGDALPRAAGVGWLGNDGVNAACTLTGGALGALAALAAG